MPPCTCRRGGHHPAGTRRRTRLGRRRRDRRVGIVGGDAPRRPVDGGAHALDVDQHVGAAVLDRLEASRSAGRTAPAPWRTRPTGRAPAGRCRAARRRRRPRRRRRGGADSSGPPSSSRGAPSSAPARSQPSARVRSMAGSASGWSSRRSTATSRVLAVGARRRRRHRRRRATRLRRRRRGPRSRPDSPATSAVGPLGRREVRRGRPAGRGSAPAPRRAPTSSSSDGRLDPTQADTARSTRARRCPHQPWSTMADQRSASGRPPSSIDPARTDGRRTRPSSRSVAASRSASWSSESSKSIGRRA